MANRLAVLEGYTPGFAGRSGRKSRKGGKRAKRSGNSKMTPQRRKFKAAAKHCFAQGPTSPKQLGACMRRELKK